MSGGPILIRESHTPPVCAQTRPETPALQPVGPRSGPHPAGSRPYDPRTHWLCWSDIDLASGRINIRNSLQKHEGRFSLVEPKSMKSDRTLVSPALAMDALRVHKRLQVVERVRMPQPSWVVILLRRFWRLFGLPFLSGDMPTYKRAVELLVTQSFMGTSAGVSLKNQA